MIHVQIPEEQSAAGIVTAIEFIIGLLRIEPEAESSAETKFN